ncbi:carboxypeptidase regulatory-like domain-containing protein [Proteobacteria bacterium 005FR1]|nr:carboxypeptidase regulatory-like domain-containing protein [Proteobacteria bacterium 005FR1]
MTETAGSRPRSWLRGRNGGALGRTANGIDDGSRGRSSRRLGIFYSVSLSIVLAGCGGGGGGSDSPPPASENSGVSSQTVGVSADAGADQTVSEFSTVQLNGAGRGSGTLSYQWTQTTGVPSVTLNGAGSATASFEAPEMEPGDSQAFTFELAVTDANGSVARDSVAVTVEDQSSANPESGSTPMLSGRLSYEHVPVRSACRGLDYASTQLRPIRGATVQLIDASTRGVIATTVSSQNGEYRFEVGAGRNVLVRVRAELKQSGSPGWNVEVRDNTSRTSLPLADRPLYVLDSAAVVVESARQLDLVAESGWDGSRYGDYRAAAPFAVLDTIYSGISLVLEADPQAFFPPLDVFWSVNNTTHQSNGLQVARGEIGNSFYNPAIDSLFLLGKADEDTEEYDSHVIAHEWGHYFEDNFSRSDSIGGPHNLGQRLDMRLAFGEGWASALAGMILEDPLYCDTSGPSQSAGFGMNMESDRMGMSGWFNEVSVAAIMYDLWDSKAVDDDGLGLGFAPIYAALVGEQATTPAFTSIFSLAAALRAQVPEQSLAVDTLMRSHGVTGSDAYGAGETNDSENGLGTDVLPIYHDIFPTGETLRVCSNGQYDSAHSGNKLSVFQYLRLPIRQNSRYRITVRNVNPPTSPGSPDQGCNEDIHSDPDFLLFRRGQLVHKGVSCSANIEDSTTEQALAPGDYLISVSEYRFADGNPSAFAPERSCFDVIVTPVQ